MLKCILMYTFLLGFLSCGCCQWQAIDLQIRKRKARARVGHAAERTLFQGTGRMVANLKAQRPRSELGLPLVLCFDRYE